jgi:hypothetical protein
MEKQKKLLALKLDNLLKHQGRRKTKVSTLAVDVITNFYFNKDFVHAKKEHCYIVINYLFILHHLQVDVPFKQKQKYVQFVLVISFLPMDIP